MASVSLIAAIAANGVIGRSGTLPWRLPADLQRFKRLTMGHTLVMGRKTWEAIGRPLPGRRTIVVTRQPGYRVPDTVVRAGSLPEALRLARDDETFVAGGAEIYAQAIGMVDRLYLTRIHRPFDGDVRFPAYDELEWQLVSRETGLVEAPEPQDPEDLEDAEALSYEFLIFERRPERWTRH